MSQAFLDPFPPKEGSLVDVYATENRASIWEQALFIAWLYTLYLPVPELSPLRSLCTLGILGLFAWNAHLTLPMLIRSWPLLPFPIVAILSSGWSPYPAEALKLGILLLLTPILLVTLAARLRPHEFIRVMMLAGALTLIFWLPHYETIRQGGGIMHKQILAYQLLLVAIVATASALNSRENLVFRIIGLIAAPVAFVLQVNAESATSLVLGTVAIIALIGSKFVWSAVAKIPQLRTLSFLFVIAAFLTGTVVILTTPQNTLASDFLALVGKESTLSGRTWIWEIAGRVAVDRPLFGIGMGGFWHPDVGLAQTLNEIMLVDPGTKMSFHSAYWEARVHLGFAGLALLLLAISWAGWRTFRLWLKDASIENTCLLVLFLVVATTFATESYLSGPYNSMVTAFYFGALAAFDAGARRRIGRTRLVERYGH